MNNQNENLQNNSQSTEKQTIFYGGAGTYYIGWDYDKMEAFILNAGYSTMIL